MLKASILTAFAAAFAVVLAATAVPSAPSARTIDEFSSAKRATHGTHARQRYARHRYAHRGYGPGGQQGGREQGRSACSGDARRLCRAYLGQGDMAVLGCFRANAGRLSRGCRAVLASYGQI
jgi:hypothetical protein